MRAYQKERFKNAVCYFAREHRRRTGRRAYQTYIYKYLALFDFSMLDRQGVPALDIPYDAMKNGPVPNFYYYKVDTDKYRFVRHASPDGKRNASIEPIAEPDLDYFSEEEIGVMREVLDEFAVPGVTTQKLIDATHDRIKAWQRAWAKHGTRTHVPMHYQHQFDEGTSEDILERFNMYKVLSGATGQCVSLG